MIDSLYNAVTYIDGFTDTQLQGACLAFFVVILAVSILDEHYKP